MPFTEALRGREYATMNWDVIGALSELFSAIAVVVTLIFLIFELRESRKIARSDSVDALAAGWNSLNTVVMADQELNSLWFNGMNDPESLNPDELKRFMMVCQSYVNHFMTVQKHYDAGHLPEEEWKYHTMGIAHLMNSPGGRVACDMIAITPTVRKVFEDYRSVQQNDGFLGIRDRNNPAGDPS